MLSAAKHLAFSVIYEGEIAYRLRMTQSARGGGKSAVLDSIESTA